MIKEFFATIGLILAAIFGAHSAPAPNTEPPTYYVSPIVPTSTAPSLGAGNPPDATTSPIKATAPALTAVLPSQTTDEVPGRLLFPTAVTHAELTTALGLLANSLRSQFVSSTAAVPSAFGSFLDPSSFVSRDLFSKQIDSIYNNISRSQRIDQLSNVTITNATVHGMAGLTAADIPTDVTAANYLPLAGGALTGTLTGTNLNLSGNLTVSGAQTLSGAITIPYLTATSSTASTFTGGFLSLASSSIGSGAQTGGLTISGGATTTGSAYFGGNVGVGTSNPAVKLDVQTGAISNGGYGGFGVHDDATDFWMLIRKDSLGNRYDALYSGNGRPLVLQQNGGNLGIGSGTTSPIATLNITGNGPSLAITDSNIVNFNYSTLKIAASSQNTFSIGVGAATPGSFSKNISIDGATGFVGIGTTTPAYKLHLVDSSPSVVVEATSSAATPQLVSKNSVTGNAASMWIGGSAWHQDRGMLYAPAWDLFADGNAGAGEIRFYTNTPGFWVDTPQLVINNLGNVGLGTTSPWRKLSVNGAVGLDGLTGNFGAGSLCLTANKEVVYNAGSDACQSSLRSTKHNIAPLDVDALAAIVALQPVSFIYNEDMSGTVRYGFIAEDAEAIDGPLATHDAQGKVSGIDDRGIISVVVKALQALIATVAGFAERITTQTLIADNITATAATFQKLCVGTTCVTESEFKALLDKHSVSPTPPPTEALTSTRPEDDPATTTAELEAPPLVPNYDLATTSPEAATSGN